MSLPLEESWKEIRMVASSIKSLYVATMNGIIRHFPGIHVPEGMIHHPLRFLDFYDNNTDVIKILLLVIN